jgi:xanthine dehydrogenase molybdopterin-binding subunit B
MGEFGIGQPVRRFEDKRFLSGNGRFQSDSNLHGQAYAYVLRSPHAHARIRKLDLAAAQAAPGITLIMTGDDLVEAKLGVMGADGVLGTPGDGKKTHQGVIQGIFTPVYQPEDAYISQLVASLSQLNAGVTTTIDTSQVSHTPAHSDACVAGLKESGRRAVYTYSPGVGPGVQYPKDLARLQSQYPPTSC